MLHYRFGSAHYRIEVRDSGSELILSLDGEQLAEAKLQLKDDGRMHHVIAQCRAAPCLPAEPLGAP
ncbi:hypothetical protein D3C71_2183120 [compost metagenome]